MRKYYLQSINKNDTKSIYDLGIYFHEIQDYNTMLRYFILSFQHNDIRPHKLLIKYFNNNLIYYNWLNSINNRNETIYKIIMEMNEITEVKIYLEKINNNLSNIKECIICYDTKININMYCGHEICVNCYCKIDCCYYKCKKNDN